MTKSTILYYPAVTTPVPGPLSVVGCSALYDSAGDQTPPVNIPTGTVVGDLIIYGVISDGPSESSPNTRTWQGPAGAIGLTPGQHQGVTYAPSYKIWTKIATAGDVGGTASFGATNANQSSAFIISINGASSAILGQTKINTTSVTSVVTTTDAMPTDSVYISLLGIQSDGATATIPSITSCGTTSVTGTASNPTGASWRSGYIGYKEYPAGGATGNTTWTSSIATRLTLANLIVT